MFQYQHKYKRVFLIALAVICFITIIPEISVRAYSARVFDKANLLSPNEVSQLEYQVNNAISIMNMDLVVLTINDANGKTSKEYADDYYDYNGYGIGEDKSGALILIDMDNREIYISTTGKMMEKLTDLDIEAIIVSGHSNLNAKDYYGCFTNCVNFIVEKVGNSQTTDNNENAANNNHVSTSDEKRENENNMSESAGKKVSENNVSGAKATMEIVVITVGACLVCICLVLGVRKYHHNRTDL